MIRSELVARIAEQNPHLFAHEVEAVVGAILAETFPGGPEARTLGTRWDRCTDQTHEHQAQRELDLVTCADGSSSGRDDRESVR